MQIKTISTVAGVNEIDFGNDSSQSTAHFYWFKNLGNSTLYVSAKPNPVAGEDNVAELSVKGAASIETDEGKVYVLGSGKVEIHRTNSKFCPFELPSTGSGGGGGESITIDSELSDTSTNPLQNKVTTAAINDVKTRLGDIPNPNLLINPDFRVDQYGFSSHTFGALPRYFIDMWTGERSVITKNSSGGIDFSWNGTEGTYGGIAQRLENSQYLFGKNVTISVNIDSVRKNISFTLPSENNKITSLKFFPNSSIGAYFGTNKESRVYVVLTSTSTTPININNIKLEVGSVATPFIPPDITTELLKCQRYRQIRSESNIAAVDLRPSMRDGVNPTIEALENGNYSYSAVMS